MSKVIMKQLDRNLTCTICGKDEFKHREVILDGKTYYPGAYEKVEEDFQLEIFTCVDCGHSIAFENYYNIDYPGGTIETQ